MTETCKHSKRDGEKGLCWACKANRHAEYQLTGTHDPEEQRKHWDEVWKVVKRLRKEKFKRKLKGENW